MVKMRLCTLRQAAILIGIVDTILSTIILMLLLLGSSHAQSMSQMIDEDVWNVAHDDTLPRATNNGVRMHQAQKLAYVTLDSIRLLIFMMTFHLISSICLLYGAVQRQREVMTLWLGSMAGIIVIATALITLEAYAGYKNTLVLVLSALSTHLYTGLWYVVFKFHRRMASEGCVVHDPEAARNLKSILIQSEKDGGLINNPQYV